VERFCDVMPLAGFFLAGVPAIKPESFAHNKLTPEECLRILQFAAWRLEEVREWQRDVLEQSLVQLAETLAIKIREFLFPLFIAIAGTSVSTSVIDSIAILGLDMSRARLRHAMATLGGISGKQQKVLEKEYQQLGAQ
jgi:glutamyl-tRNA synthetase